MYHLIAFTFIVTNSPNSIHHSIFLPTIFTVTSPPNPIDAGSSNRKPNSLWPGMHHSPATHALWEARSIIFEKPVNGNSDPSSFDPKSPSLSSTSILYNFSSDLILREQYRNPWNHIRMGKLVEDFDAIAGTIALKHCCNEDGSTRPLLLVTAAVDKMVLKKSIQIDADFTIVGAVTWVGRSSMEIQLEMIQSPQAENPNISNSPGIVANFTFVARDSNTGKAAPINQNTFHRIPQLANHGLVVIPFLSASVSLRVLNLSGNGIVKITVGALPRGLHTLNLSKNNISTIEGLRELTRLRVLDLSYNRILRIGHGPASCSSLKELYLAGNKIGEVEGLHRLLKISIWDLRFNKISTAKCLGQLAANYNSLLAISLEGNPCQKNVGDEQIKKYLQGLLPHLVYYNRPAIACATRASRNRDLHL
ncbi:hypothetical protein RYX36_022764 [Vicia faba]